MIYYSSVRVRKIRGSSHTDPFTNSEIPISRYMSKRAELIILSIRPLLGTIVPTPFRFASTEPLARASWCQMRPPPCRPLSGGKARDADARPIKTIFYDS